MGEVWKFVPWKKKKKKKIKGVLYICQHKGPEAAKKLFHIQSTADISRDCFPPMGVIQAPNQMLGRRVKAAKCRPATKKKNCALHYSESSQGRKRRKDMCIVPG